MEDARRSMWRRLMEMMTSVTRSTTEMVASVIRRKKAEGEKMTIRGLPCTGGSSKQISLNHIFVISWHFLINYEIINQQMNMQRSAGKKAFRSDPSIHLKPTWSPTVGMFGLTVKGIWKRRRTTSGHMLHHVTSSQCAAGNQCSSPVLLHRPIHSSIVL